MPTYRDVEVQVVDRDRQPLVEYGVSKNSRTSLCYCFVKSETNMQFSIRIRPEAAIVREGRAEEADEDENEEEDDDDDEEDWYDDIERKDKPKPKEEHLLATLRLDGRNEIEKRSLIFLDRNHDLFPDPNGEVLMKHAVIRDEYGVWKECKWFFKDVGIDVTLQNMQIESEAPEQTADDLAELFDTIYPKLDGEDQEAKSKVGQIEVRLDRVTVNRTVDGIAAHLHKSRDMTALSGSNIGDAEHTVGRSEGLNKLPPRQTTYFDFIEPGTPYAIFRFNYSNERKLRKLGFLGPLPASRGIGKRDQALKLAAAVQLKKPRGGPNAYKFRNLELSEVDDGAEGDDEKSGGEDNDQDGSESDEAVGGPGEDLGELDERLGELDMYRTRKRDDDEEEQDGKKVKAA